MCMCVGVCVVRGEFRPHTFCCGTASTANEEADTKKKSNNNRSHGEEETEGSDKVSKKQNVAVRQGLSHDRNGTLVLGGKTE